MLKKMWRISTLWTLIGLVILTVLSIFYGNEIDAHHETLRELEEAKMALVKKTSGENDLSQKITDLNAQLKSCQAINVKNPLANGPTPLPSILPTTNSEHQSAQSAQSTFRELAIEGHIKAISKFVPLSDEQQSRLKAKYQLESQPGIVPGKDSETLDSIIGSDQARFYRDERQKAFQRAKDEDLEKDVLFLSRKLTLDPGQENDLRKTFQDVESEIQNPVPSNSTNGPSDRSAILKNMLDKEQQRSTLLAEKLKAILTQEQYLNYTQYQANSSSQDMQMWHGRD